MAKKDFDRYLASNRYPRRSAEIWEDGHLSEVALLGRETPARPLRDTKFTRTGEKKVFNRPTTFAMVSPGSANTYVPDGSDEQEEYNKMPDMTMPDHEEDASIKKDLLAKYRMENDELKDKIFSCMSQRASANIRDEMEVLGPLRLTEVQEAQKAIINVARTMSDEGTIVLAGRGGDDFV